MKKIFCLSMFLIGLVSNVMGQDCDLDFSTYFGGSDWEYARDIVVDKQGNIYITGGTKSTDFPITSGVCDTVNEMNGPNTGRLGSLDLFISKFDPTGQQLIWSTYLGGPNHDRAYAIEVDDQGYVYVAGRAGPGFPVKNAFQPTFQGSNQGDYGDQNAFVAKLTPNATDVVWASYLGTGWMTRDMAIDDSGNMYVFLEYYPGIHIAPPPASWFANGYQKNLMGDHDCGIAKIKHDGSGVEWATWLSGSGRESACGGIRVDKQGYVYVAIHTTSPDMPTTPGVCDDTYNGLTDFYVAKLSPDGSQLIYGTYVGDAGENWYSTHNMNIDDQGHVYLAFWGSNAFPVTDGPFHTGSGGGGSEMVVVKLAQDGSLLKSTWIGGNQNDNADGIYIDNDGNVFVSGSTGSNDMPVTNSTAFQTAYGGGTNDAYLFLLSADFSKLLYATYIGGSAHDSGNSGFMDAEGKYFYITGSTDGTGSTGWPTKNAYQDTFAGGWDNYGAGDNILAKFSVAASSTPGGTTPVSWQPPIGIPRPDFGIEETYRMYDDPANQNPALTYTQNAEGGYYTHYIDNTHSQATDTNNPYGTAGNPKLTIPATLAEGSVVEIHGGPYTQTYIIINAAGTQQKPVFLRGFDFNNKPVITSREFRPLGSHMIAENIDMYGNTTVIILPPSNHIALRNSEIHNSVPTAKSSAMYMGSWNPSSPDTVQHIVVYNNKIFDRGLYQAGIDDDSTGVAVGHHADNIWIVDNEIYNVTGSGVVVNAGTGMTATTHHLYIGRNIAHDIYQSGFGVKQCQDVIFSQNVAYNILARLDVDGSIQSPSKGFGFQYGPERIWFLFNEIYDCEIGIFSATSSGGTGQNIYIIGNLIHNIHNINTNLIGFWGQSAIMMTDETQTKYIVSNTIYDSDEGITGVRGGILKIENNILNNVAHGHIWIENHGNALADSDVDYTVFDSPAEIHWGSSTAYALSIFQSAIGKGLNCIEADPQFVDPANNNFHLQSTSPAIDAGTSSGIVQQVFDTFQQLYGIDIRKDIEGGVRPYGAEWDIGAYEYGASTNTIQPPQPPKPPQPPLPPEPPVNPAETQIPTKTDMQCYNNVINPSKDEEATINIELDEQARVTIVIYDNKGKEIKKLMDDEKQPGFYSIKWNGKDSSSNTVGSGIYLVHIKTGNYTETKKIAVVK